MGEVEEEVHRGTSMFASHIHMRRLLKVLPVRCRGPLRGEIFSRKGAKVQRNRKRGSALRRSARNILGLKL